MLGTQSFMQYIYLKRNYYTLGGDDDEPVPVAWVCCRSPSEIVGSNPTGGHGCLSVVSVVCCQVEVSATG